jgi:hypothetical protein
VPALGLGGSPLPSRAGAGDEECLICYTEIDALEAGRVPACCASVCTACAWEVVSRRGTRKACPACQRPLSGEAMAAARASHEAESERAAARTRAAADAISYQL